MNALMKTAALTGTVLVGLATASGAGADDLKDTAVGVLTKGLLGGDKAFIEEHVAEDYIQHNPIAPDGRDGLLGYVDYAQSLKPDLDITPVRILRDGDLVAIQSEYTLGGETIVFDLFRFENGKIVEHWDGIQAKPEKTVSSRSMTDGTSDIVDLDNTDVNRALVTNFVNDILVSGQGDKITDYIGNVYLQHNPGVADGLDELGTFLAYLEENDISFSYKQVHNVVAEGNFVMTQSEGEIGGVPNAFFDLFRVEDGKIVEHWDVIQEIPADMQHENGMF